MTTTPNHFTVTRPSSLEVCITCSTNPGLCGFIVYNHGVKRGYMVARVKMPVDSFFGYEYGRVYSGCDEKTAVEIVVETLRSLEEGRE